MARQDARPSLTLPEELERFKDKGDQDLKLLGGLSYAILNKVRLSYIYDFN
jgi:hypothetical protein